MSIIDDKAPVILDWIDKIGSDFQRMLKTKFGPRRISAKPTVLVNFCKFLLFSSGGGGDFNPPPPSPFPRTGVGRKK